MSVLKLGYFPYIRYYHNGKEMLTSFSGKLGRTYYSMSDQDLEQISSLEIECPN